MKEDGRPMEPVPGLTVSPGRHSPSCFKQHLYTQEEIQTLSQIGMAL